jgi:putative DNA primase/helicase
MDWVCTDPATGLVDLGMRRTLQQWAGYCLTGDVSKEVVMFFHGSGANGKGTFIETLQSVMGSYFYMATKDLFMQGKYGPHTEEIAALAGKRMVVADEVPTDARWNESLLKAVSGGGSMTTRHLYKQVFTFPIQFKVTIVGNEKPSFQGAINEALKRRLHMAQFRMTAKPRDTTLKATLAAEGAGVLRWAINGYLDVVTGSKGLFVADSVIAATDEYFSENDMMGQWLGECVRAKGGASVASSEAFNSWEAFRGSEGGGGGFTHQKSFRSEMIRRGYRWTRTNKGSVFNDIVLVERASVF